VAPLHDDIPRNGAHEPQQRELYREQHGVGNQARVPLFHRRKPGGMSGRHDYLADDAEKERGGERTEERGSAAVAKQGRRFSG
jgi:hypothetical protein